MSTEFLHSRLPATHDALFHGDAASHEWIPKLPYRALGQTGLNVSTLSYGGSALGGFYGNVEKREAVETIQESIKSGINYLDTSPWYGDSERIIGESLHGIPRSTYYIGTKVGRNYTPTWEGRFDFSAAAVLRNVEQSLERLGIDYVDIIQVHDVEFCQDINTIIKETIPALESVVRAGKAKFIGITGYDTGVLKEIVRRVPVGALSTILSYARLNFHDASLLKSTDFFANRNVGVINAAPLAMGLLTTNGPPKWHPASDATKESARNAAVVAKNYGTTLESVSLSHSLRPAHPSIATTLVSIPTKKILKENLEIVTSPPLSEKKMELHQRILEEFRSRNAGHWEGVETEQYRDWLRNNQKL